MRNLSILYLSRISVIRIGNTLSPEEISLILYVIDRVKCHEHLRPVYIHACHSRSINYHTRAEKVPQPGPEGISKRICSTFSIQWVNKHPPSDLSIFEDAVPWVCCTSSTLGHKRQLHKEHKGKLSSSNLTRPSMNSYDLERIRGHPPLPKQVS